MKLLALDRLGVHERPDGCISFGALLPGIAPPSFGVSVKVIHTADQFLQSVKPQEFPLNHSKDEASGEDYWSTTVRIERSRGSGPWGEKGRYVYRYSVKPRKQDEIDWISDPFAREFGIGALSAFTLGYRPYQWSESEARWKTPPIHDLVIYEMMLAEFAGNIQGATDLLHYVADLGVNCIELMPVTNSGIGVDWGFLPIGYFGVAARYGTRADMHRFVDEAHSRGIAVIFDSVFGHTGKQFGYHYLYEELRKRKFKIDHPFSGITDRKMYGEPTNWRRTLTANFFFTVSHFWLDRFHIDGFRYDCVPEFRGKGGKGFTALVECTWKHVREHRGGHWERFHGENGTFNLVTCAEDVEESREVLDATYANCVWQNGTFDAAAGIASKSERDVTPLGRAMALFGFRFHVPDGSETIPKAVVQYIENHDQKRFICQFDQERSLFEGCKRDQWPRVRPYLIALLTAKGIPLLWQGQEFCENYWLPREGVERPYFPRPLRWELMYTVAGQQLLSLVRGLLRIRRERVELRRGEHFFYDDPDYTKNGILIVSRGETSPHTIIVALNFTTKDVKVPFTYPAQGWWSDALVIGGGVDSEQQEISIPANHGRVLMLSGQSVR